MLTWLYLHHRGRCTEEQANPADPEESQKEDPRTSGAIAPTHEVTTNPASDTSENEDADDSGHLADEDSNDLLADIIAVIMGESYVEGTDLASVRVPTPDEQARPDRGPDSDHGCDGPPPMRSFGGAFWQ